MAKLRGDGVGDRLQQGVGRVREARRYEEHLTERDRYTDVRDRVATVRVV